MAEAEERAKASTVPARQLVQQLEQGHEAAMAH